MKYKIEILILKLLVISTPTNKHTHLQKGKSQQTMISSAMRSSVNRAYNKAHFESNLLRPLVPCPSSWLPEETAHLASRPLVIKKVWFPEDANGEPHEANPDDGCGGAKYKLNNIHYYDSDKTEVKAADRDATNAYYREAMVSFECLFDDSDYILDNNLANKIAIWLDFQQKTDALNEPDYGSMGALWATIFNSKPRLEE